MAKCFMFAALLIAAVMLYAGCGTTNHDCSLTAFSISPSTATADHTAAAPGNSVPFFAGPVLPKGCVVAIPACVNCWGQTWTVTDSVNVSISNNPSDNGTATCLGATSGAVTVTASLSVAGKSTRTVTGSASLTCK